MGLPGWPHVTAKSKHIKQVREGRRRQKGQDEKGSGEGMHRQVGGERNIQRKANND